MNIDELRATAAGCDWLKIESASLIALIDAAEALRAACVMAHGRACFKTSNGVPQGMPTKAERVVRAALAALDKTED